eukprot:6211804-Pleurochrysis_carterae.AAC.7
MLTVTRNACVQYLRPRECALVSATVAAHASAGANSSRHASAWVHMHAYTVHRSRRLMPCLSARVGAKQQDMKRTVIKDEKGSGSARARARACACASERAHSRNRMGQAIVAHRRADARSADERSALRMQLLGGRIRLA